MLKAAREGHAPAAASGAAVKAPVAKAAAAPAPPPVPVKPAPKPTAEAEPVARRGFLSALGALVATPFALAWTSFATATGAFTLGLARFAMPNILVEPPSKFKVGPPGDYPLGTVSTRWTARFGVWIVHAIVEGQNQLYALASVCTHLGCTPSWLESEQKFKCPCHGSGFYITGMNFEGPAPRPLERVGVRVAEDGLLEVDKSVKFQWELGQWADPASRVDVA
jgi:cytochrome b6-f complex iron-sulfur subunit